MGTKYKTPKIVTGKENILSGKDLVEMGFRITVDGFLIATGLKYSVWVYPPHLGGWKIKLINNGK